MVEETSRLGRDVTTLVNELVEAADDRGPAQVVFRRHGRLDFLSAVVTAAPWAVALRRHVAAGLFVAVRAAMVAGSRHRWSRQRSPPESLANASGHRDRVEVAYISVVRTCAATAAVTRQWWVQA